MRVTVPVFVVALLGLNTAVLSIDRELSYPGDITDVKSPQKRQLAEHRNLFYCKIPNPLKNGRYYPHRRRCPSEDHSAVCRLVPGTWVPQDFVIRYACNPGYKLHTTRIASICYDQQGEVSWVPPLPQCLESTYHSSLLPSTAVCGIPARNLNTRIQRAAKRKFKIRGKPSPRGKWPWMVIFGHRKSRNPRDGFHWFCAGTLVTTRHVLTAAICVEPERKRPLFIARLDVLDLNKPEQESHAIEVNIMRNNIIPHPRFKQDYNKDKLLNNIAVVKLDSDIRITDFIRPICLPTPDFQERNFVGEVVHFTSWGQTDNEREPFVSVLHEMEAKIVDHEECKTIYKKYQVDDTPPIIYDHIICAFVNVSTSCQSDIGSPLMLKYEGNFYLLGIEATGVGRCYEKEFPRLFTKVANYMEWIVSNMEL